VQNFCDYIFKFFGKNIITNIINLAKMSFSSANPAHLFIDLATFSEQEGFMYGGPDAITWFVGAVQKSNWFSYIPITLRQSGVVDFGQKNVSASLNRSGDYVLHSWFRAQIPQIELVQDGTIFLDATLRWTRNLMHNIFYFRESIFDI
jgi:hypothetical protein